MTIDAATNERATEMFTRLSQALRDHRRDHHANFTGLVYVSVMDLQCLADEAAYRDSVRYKRPVQRAKVHHGYQARVLGVRVVADSKAEQLSVRLEK